MVCLVSSPPPHISHLWDIRWFNVSLQPLNFLLFVTVTVLQNFLSKPQLVTGDIINLRNNNLLALYINKIVIICSSK